MTMTRENFINGPRPGQRARVGKAETAALNALAEFESVNTSEAIRMAIREAARKRGLWPPQVTAGAGQ